MFTSTIFIALAGFLPSLALESPSWHADYGTAQELGSQGHKPLAVFIGSGKAGWNRLSQDGQLGKDIKSLLAKRYICVYIDTNLKNGRQLASEFEIPARLGIILSDHTGRYQAFRHEGDLSSENLLYYLRRYADPERIVRTTETNPPEPANYYAPASYYPAPTESYYQPYPVIFSSSRGGC